MLTNMIDNNLRQEYKIVRKYDNRGLTMKVTTRQILSSVDSLNKLINEKLPARVAFRVAQVSRQLDTHIQDYNKTLTKLQQEHCSKDDEGKMVKNDQGIIQFEDKDVFHKEHEELLSCTVEVNGSKLKLDQLSSMNVEPAIFYHLDWFVQE